MPIVWIPPLSSFLQPVVKNPNDRIHPGRECRTLSSILYIVPFCNSADDTHQGFFLSITPGNFTDGTRDVRMHALLRDKKASN
jgi:hypothetical protein